MCLILYCPKTARGSVLGPGRKSEPLFLHDPREYADILHLPYFWRHISFAYPNSNDYYGSDYLRNADALAIRTFMQSSSAYLFICSVAPTTIYGRFGSAVVSLRLSGKEALWRHVSSYEFCMCSCRHHRFAGFDTIGE